MSSPTIHVRSASASTASRAASKKATLGLPAVLVQAVEVGPAVQLGERARQVHVGEDASGLGRLVCAAEQHRVGALADELDSLEILDDGGHREREHAPAGERARSRARRGLELLVGQVDVDRAQLLHEGLARPSGAVRDEVDAMAAFPQLVHGPRGPG
jgi:hypothetical protein